MTDPPIVTLDVTGESSSVTQQPLVGSRCALARLVGTRRARILKTLTTPKTTEQAATAAGIARSTASEHLHQLALARVVHRFRRGRFVYYVLNSLGQRLVEELNTPVQRSKAIKKRRL